MMFLSLPVEYSRCNKNSLERRRSLSTRSYSHGEVTQNTNHYRNNSTHSMDVFKLIVPTNTDSTLSHLICSICSLPMTKPTVLPCQHTFCFKCLQNSQQTRSNSLPIHPNSCLVSNLNSEIVIKCQKCSHVHNIKSLADLEENQSVGLLINTLLCEQCHQLHPSKQLDTCSHCFAVICSICYEKHTQNHKKHSETNRNSYRLVSTDGIINTSMITNSDRNDQNLDTQVFQPTSFNTVEKSTTLSCAAMTLIENHHDEDIDPSQTNTTKKKSNNIFRKIMNPSSHYRLINFSSKDVITKNSIPISMKKTSSIKLSHRKKLTIDTNIKATLSQEETTQATVPNTPVGQFINLHDQYTITVQHIKQCKKRQSELDRTVKKLIEVLTMKTNENINHIIQYWIDFKQILLDQYQSKINRFFLFNYLLKTCCSKSDSRRQIDFYITQNNDIKLALETLSVTLMFVMEKESLITISRLFDREQQATIRKLKNQLESLLSSYSDGLSFINELIHVYESRFAAWKDSDLTELNILTEKWTQIVKEDYPSLVKMISDHFITTVPQIEKVLKEMLNNMQEHFLYLENRTRKRKTNRY